MIQSLIIELRGERVILDSDLAMLYGVPTKGLNQAVKRNKNRFPADFVFQLTKDEYDFLKSQIVTSGRISEQKRKLPYVFTRNGANMVCTVLKSPIAVHRSIQIMRAFSTLETLISRKQEKMLISSEINKKLSAHARAILQLFQKDKVKGVKIDKMNEIQSKVISLIQQMIISSLNKDE